MSAVPLRFLRSIAVACLISLSGCRSQPPSGRLGIPAPDRARLLVVKVADTPDKRHWKWSVLAGRNWESPVIDGTTAVLEGGYPLNAAMRSGGCHTWEMDLSAKRAGERWNWAIELHGSNGRTARSSGTALSIEPVSTLETETGLPCELRLARIDGNPVVLRLPR